MLHILLLTAAFRERAVATRLRTHRCSAAQLRVRSQIQGALEDGWQDWLDDGLSCVECASTSPPNLPPHHRHSRTLRMPRVCTDATPDGLLQLGVYTAYSMLESEPHIRPFCASSVDDGVSALFADESVPAVPLSAVRAVIDPELCFVSERQAGGGQGLGNPHGEHGESCFDLSDAVISDAVTLVVIEGRDTERVL